MNGDYETGEPCKVCGSTELKLIDGFYYCIECGTQDATVRETVIEVTTFDEGPPEFMTKESNEIKKTIKETESVSPEWHKWHCYNYILVGMLDELISLGAEPSVKTKVLWMWSMYMKKFQNKKELGLPVEEEDDDSDDSIVDLCRTNKIRKPNMERQDKARAFNVSEISSALFLAMLYLALIFDKSDIQLTHLIRFIQEGRLTYVKVRKFVPKEIDLYLIDDFKYFAAGTWNPSPQTIRLHAMTFIKTFKLGPPILPNLEKIADRYITELCLPDDFKNLVYSFMQLVPYDDLFMDELLMKKSLRIPFYECVVMSYIVVCLKMCFGLDDDYEIKLSDAVDQINIENGHMKCYKLGIFSTFSDRLFSFRQWCSFLRLRKALLYKFYWPMAQFSNMDKDDYVYMEQKAPPSNLSKHIPSLSDEITMNILSKIDTDLKINVIPRSAFHHTLTPLTTYTNLILEYYKDSELRLLLSEDFTKYSLKYACEKLELRVNGNAKNIVVGVDESGKHVNPDIQGEMSHDHLDVSMVYVRNCENKNWLITNPPTLNHIEKVCEDINSDKETNGCVLPENKYAESDTEISKTNQGSIKDGVDVAKKTELLQDESVNIFDDDFDNLEVYDEKIDNVNIKTEPIDADMTETNHDIDDTHDVDNDHLSARFENIDDSIDNDNIDYNIGYFFNPETFNREETIRELVLLTCKKYRIPIPPEFRTKERKKIIRTRKPQTSEPKTKKARLSSAEVQGKICDLLSAYRDKLGDDIFANLSKNIRDIVKDLDNSRNDVDSKHNKNCQDDENFHNNATFDQRANNESVVDTNASVLLAENEVIGSDHEDDPNTQADLFDENIYDIKQLYLRVQETGIEDDFDVSNDPEIDKLLTEKIDECENVVANKKRKKVAFKESDRWLSEHTNLEQCQHLKYLIKNRQRIQKFNYWTRHPPNMFRIQNDRSGKSRFNRELNENFPKSFAFVLRECAAMLNSSPRLLYRSVVRLEMTLLCELK